MNQFILGRYKQSICDIESRIQYESKVFVNERHDEKFIKEKLDGATKFNIDIKKREKSGKKCYYIFIFRIRGRYDENN